MSFKLNKEDYSLIIHQGDSGKIKIKNIPTNNNYLVCIAFQNSKREILESISLFSENKSELIFNVETSITEKFIVPPNLKCQIYYWGIVLFDKETGSKDTTRIGTTKLGDLNKLIVFPKKA